ncbi:hypothetical protein [Pseudonocardia sp. KRD291]|uniref:hypothetical protein n=1 Tax=Pseudonocardia sp. KRD291 TaxID=2792007 RepID=UPI001C4A60AB|nr:hypothetical protein [Pseudonocardia sp. KRD291]MBW0100882.1 hypothetical protein [Pseudonocardia sp. KRD291]
MAVSETTTPTVVVVGLLADAGLPTEVSEDLARELPDRLGRDNTGRARWQVDISQALIHDQHGTSPSVQFGQQAMADQGWDLVIPVTELPRRAGIQPIISDYGADTGVGLVSLPALGGLGLLAGRVRADRPWRLVPSLSPTIAGAAAGAAFGILYSNIWRAGTLGSGPASEDIVRRAAHSRREQERRAHLASEDPDTDKGER